MDEIVTGAGAAPTPDAATGSPAPSETPAAPEKSSRFAALMADEAESGEDQAGEASTDDAETETDEGAEPTKEEAAPDKETPPDEQEPEDEEALPKDLKAALKKFPQLRGAYYHQRDIMPLGISVEEAQTYRESIQSLEDLRDVVDRSRQLDAFEGLFNHPDEDAPQKFLDVLKMVNEDSAGRFVRSLAKNLRTVAPEAYLELGGEFWDKGMGRLTKLAGDDPLRIEAVATIKEMMEELAKDSGKGSEGIPLASPDAEELKRRREAEASAKTSAEDQLRKAANQAADVHVRALVEEVRKRRDPNDLLATPDDIEKIVHEVHRSVAQGGPLQRIFAQTLRDSSIPQDQRIAKAAALVKARASNLVELIWTKNTKGTAERLRKASQLKLGKAAKVVSMREATGGRPAATPPPPLPRGARLTSRDIFRAAMKG